MALVKKVIKDHPSAEIAIAHSGVPEKAEKIAARITRETSKEPLYIQETSSTLGVHVGKGCVGVGIFYVE